MSDHDAPPPPLSKRDACIAQGRDALLARLRADRAHQTARYDVQFVGVDDVDGAPHDRFRVLCAAQPYPHSFAGLRQDVTHVRGEATLALLVPHARYTRGALPFYCDAPLVFAALCVALSAPPLLYLALPVIADAYWPAHRWWA